MKKLLFLLSNILLITTVWLTPTFCIATDSTNKFFQNITNSDLIVTGYFSESKIVSKRLNEKDLQDLYKTIGGYLYTLHIKDVIVAKSDFNPGLPRPNLAGQTLAIFKTRQQFLADNIQEHHYYLVFLTLLPKQEQLIKENNLADGQNYYFPLENSNGSIPLNNSNLPLLVKMQKFGKAIQPLNKAEKVRKLMELMNATDPDLKESAKEAIKIVEKMD